MAFDWTPHAPSCTKVLALLAAMQASPHACCGKSLGMGYGSDRKHIVSVKKYDHHVTIMVLRLHMHI